MLELHTLGFAYAKGVQTREFLDMVQSRWRVDIGMCQSELMIARLDTVVLRGVPGFEIFDTVEKERLQKLAAEGLNIRLDPYDQALAYPRV